ncbi:MAG: CaiB/BaiF CoA transferase family protein [Ardenticatenaceae bacterium]
MSGPLSSLKVLDFSTLLPGPFASMMLADLGAEVLRVEAPNRFDFARLAPPFDGQTSAWHALVHRSKRSLALNLKRPGAAEVIKRLVQTHDIVLEQFRPGVMDRLGIGYEALRAVNPRVIYCAVTAYGQTGPLKDRAGHDVNYLGLAGVMSHTGRRDGGPLPLGVAVGDVGGGSFGALTGILAAVIERTQSGEGQFVDISMFDACVSWNSVAARQYLVGGQEPERETEMLNGGTYYDYYRTADGRYLSVGSLEPKFWIRFCQVLECPDLMADGHILADLEEQRAIKAEIQEIIATRTLDEWVERFADADACVEPVLTVAEMVEHPQTKARHMVVEVPKPDGTTQRQIGLPYKFSASRPTYRHIGAQLGQHTADVLSEIGYTTQDIEQMRRDGFFS